MEEGWLFLLAFNIGRWKQDGCPIWNSCLLAASDLEEAVDNWDELMTR